MAGKGIPKMLVSGELSEVLQEYFALISQKLSPSLYARWVRYHALIVAIILKIMIMRYFFIDIIR